MVLPSIIAAASAVALLIPSIMAYEGWVCIDKEIPLELQDLATILTIQENPSNMEQPHASLALGEKTLWAPGRTLRVKILNACPYTERLIRKFANEWTEYANIHFEWVDWGETEIRVRIEKRGQSWSYMGTHNLAIPQTEPTMNIVWPFLTSVRYLKQTVLHEFGHALGCVHEHQSPASGIPWNRAAVMKYFTGIGFNESQVMQNIFLKYDKNTTQYSEFDEDSIMLYPIPRTLTLNGYKTKINWWLSKMDKDFLSYVYPFHQGQPFPDYPSHEVKSSPDN